MKRSIADEIEKSRVQKKEDPEINLYMLLVQTYDIVSSAIDLELKYCKTTQSQVTVLTMLSRENRPLTLEEISKWSLRGFNSVSTLINRMEKKGLIRKIKKDDDPKTYIVPTEKGDTLYHLKVTERSIHAIMNSLTDGEKQQFAAILRKVRSTTRDLLGLDFRPPFLP